MGRRDRSGRCRPGRPAVQQRKGFIRIPAFDELFAEWKKQRDDTERAADIQFGSTTLPKPQRRDFVGFGDHLREIQTEGDMALRWIASLRPPFPVEMVDTDREPNDPIEWYILCRYDPATGT